MTTAADFQTNALYPGGEGKCKVGTEDLYPSDPWYVNVSMADLHKWMWNLEVWDVSLDCASVVKDSPSDTEWMDFDVSISGQFHNAYFQYDGVSVGTNFFTATGDCLYTPPNRRVCGQHYRTTETESSGPTNTTNQAERILPVVYASIGHSGLESDPYTKSDTLNISDGTSTVGDLSFTGTLDNFGAAESFGGASMDFKYIRLLGNGTADVHFIADAFGDYSAGFVGITRLSPLNDPLSDETATSFTISVLGSNFTAYVMTQRDIYAGTPSAGPAPDSFSFTYAIAVTTAYTY